MTDLLVEAGRTAVLNSPQIRERGEGLNGEVVVTAGAKP
jgi:hypothetical protein